MEKNWLYADVDGLLVSNSEYPDVQEQIVLQFKLLVEFLIDEELLTGDVKDWRARDIRALRLFASDLNEEGRRLFSPPINAYFKWLAANDRDTRKPISMRGLESGLKKVRLQTH